MSISLAIDIGATKISIGLVNQSGQILSSRKIESAASSQAELNQRLATALSAELATTTEEISGVGIGSAGPINHFTGTINPVNIPVWSDFSLVDFVKSQSECSKIRLIGDASALTFAEFKIGAGIGSKNLLGVVVSTGIGGGAVLDGKFFPGHTGNAGFIGHTVIVQGGLLCPCGNNGCVEAYASGPSMVRWCANHGLDMSGINDFRDIAELARAGNPIAIESISHGAQALALALVNAIATMDLDRIVIGGGVMKSDAIYWQPLERAFLKQRNILGYADGCQLIPAKLGIEAGLIGAGLAALAL